MEGGILIHKLYLSTISKQRKWLLSTFTSPLVSGAQFHHGSCLQPSSARRWGEPTWGPHSIPGLPGDDFFFLATKHNPAFSFYGKHGWNPLPGTASRPVYWPSTACHVTWRWRAPRLRATHVLTTALVQRRWGGRWHDDKWSVHWSLLSVTSPVSVFPECFQVSISSSSPLSARKVWWRVERECNRDDRGGKKLSLEKFQCAYLGKNMFFFFL